MRRIRTSTVGAAGLAVLMLFPAAGFAASAHHEARDAATVERGPEGARLAHMGGGMAGKPGMMAPAQGYMAGPCQGYGPSHGMGSGMMGPRMMGQGMGPGMMMGQGMGSGMMGPNMMGPGMGQGMGRGEGQNMAPGTMGPGMGQGMGPNMMGQGMGPGAMQALPQDLTLEQVRHMFEHRLDRMGNPNIKVGDVVEADEDTITAEIVTNDGSLVQRFMVDRHTGAMRSAQ